MKGGRSLKEKGWGDRVFIIEVERDIWWEEWDW